MSFLCFINFLMFSNGRTDTPQAFTIIVLTSVGRLLTRRWSGGVFSHTPFGGVMGGQFRPSHVSNSRVLTMQSPISF